MEAPMAMEFPAHTPSHSYKLLEFPGTHYKLLLYVVFLKCLRPDRKKLLLLKASLYDWLQQPLRLKTRTKAKAKLGPQLVGNPLSGPYFGGMSALRCVDWLRT